MFSVTQKVESRKGYPGPDVPKDEENLRWFMRNSLEFCNKMQRPRTIKTHLALSVLPKDLTNKCKVKTGAYNQTHSLERMFEHQTSNRKFVTMF